MSMEQNLEILNATKTVMKRPAQLNDRPVSLKLCECEALHYTLLERVLHHKFCILDKTTFWKI